ncbi:chemotaxis protein CheY [Clostridiales bacterium PH28_bin88]|nr:chemotaxis protein CheY [Clostridiales bacterium PH28_bin88]
MSKRQLAMVIDINKCLGCHTCTIADKNMWLRGEGQEYMCWNNVETRPGKGFPANWERLGGGWKDGEIHLGKLPALEDYGIPWSWDWEQLPHIAPQVAPTWGPNWEEDVGAGDYPNVWYFYLARPCNHCTKPACVAACPRKAVYKRDEDGIVLIDQERCRGYRYCVRACPYKKPYFNAIRYKSEKCIFCFPRVEQGVPPACVGQCPGRIRFFGYLDDREGPVYKLVKEFQVALPLHPELVTEPNVYYIPPLSPPRVDAQGRPGGEGRIPVEYLESLFGPQVRQVLSRLEAELAAARLGKPSELVATLISNHRWRI